MRTGRFAACAATISTVVLFALSGSAQALASAGGNGAGNVAADLEEATVICEPNGIVNVTATSISCVILQPDLTPPGSSESQDNQARCIEESSAPVITETCLITQGNVAGSNRATVQQTIRQRDGSSQFGKQRATITQTTMSGSNDANADQDLSQSTDTGGSQTQESNQGFRPGFGDPGVTILQNNNTGANAIELNQSAKQTEKNHKDAALQQQVSEQSSHLDQHHTPLDGGPSRTSIKQDVDQKQDGTNPANVQVADPHCCNFFDGSEVHVDLRQDVNQRGMMGTLQFADNTAHCVVMPASAGNCNVRETISQNGATITNTCNSPTCSIGQSCLNATCAPCPTVEGGPPICPPPPFCVGSICDRPTLGLSGVSAYRLTPLAVRLFRSELPVPLLAA